MTKKINFVLSIFTLSIIIYLIFGLLFTNIIDYPNQLILPILLCVIVLSTFIFDCICGIIYISIK